MYSLPFKMQVPFVSEDQVAIRDHLIRAVRDESFTPFLGAGASSLRPRELQGSHWRRVIQRLSRLHADLESEPDRQYLRSIAKARGVELSKAEFAEPLRPRDELDEALFSLQLALIQLGSSLAHAFGEEMARTRACVPYIEDCGVSLSDRDQRGLLREMFLNAADAAMKTRDMCRPREESRLHARIIYDNLLICCCRMCASDAHDCQRSTQRCQKHCARLDKLVLGVVDLQTRHTLRLDELSWLSDLLWHTVRFPVPAYPTTSELTFQLSLMIASSQQLWKGRLAQVAELQGQYDEQLGAISSWLDFCEKGNKPAALHRATAAALQHQYQEKCSEAGESLPWPMAFTTNYDRALERAFESLSLPYHVVFPVFAGSSGSAKRSQESTMSQDEPDKVTQPPLPYPTSVAWVFMTVFPEHTRRSLSPDDCTKWQSDHLGEREIVGPIVVKLHGSPLHGVPGAKDLDMPQKTVLQHCLVLAESSYLATIMTDNPYPPWIEWGLKARNRSMWFMGYSIADWNIRLRLFEHIRPRIKAFSGEGSPTMRVAYGRDFDYLAGAVLGALGVTIYKGELDALAAWLSEIPEVQTTLDAHLGQARGL